MPLPTVTEKVHAASYCNREAVAEISSAVLMQTYLFYRIVFSQVSKILKSKCFIRSFYYENTKASVVESVSSRPLLHLECEARKHNFVQIMPTMKDILAF